MKIKLERFWKEMFIKLQRAAGFHSPSFEEAEKELGEAINEHLSDEEIDSMVHAVTARKSILERKRT